MNELDRWTGEVRAALGLAAAHPDERTLVLDLARDVAHGVVRPAAPVSAYLLGLAVGRGADPVRAAATINDLAARWERSAEAPGRDGSSAPPARPE
jgi:Domain of unknown function (DUF6457)